MEYDNDKPILLDCRVRKEDHVYPMVPAGKALDEMIMFDEYHNSGKKINIDRNFIPS